jgi:hypothetical protein
MIPVEDPGGGSGSGPVPGPGSWRDRRIGELRRRIEELRATIADAQRERRRVFLELNELLEEQRRHSRARPEAPADPAGPAPRDRHGGGAAP